MIFRARPEPVEGYRASHVPLQPMLIYPFGIGGLRRAGKMSAFLMPALSFCVTKSLGGLTRVVY